MNTIHRIFVMAMLMAIGCFAQASSPKREFRGAWMHTVFQDQYKKQSTQQNKRYICSQLDLLKKAGINVVFFQIRPQSDAFYKSPFEPWSIFLTDGGKAPEPFWDPLSFITEQAHQRGMELHAWINPYRVTSGAKQQVPPGHIYHKHPERFVKYDGKIYFDPGLPENRTYIEKIVADVVTRYDIDGIHFDDYFYPYPVKNLPFPDSKSYARYGKGQKRDDWRRDNVNKLIQSLNAKIKSIKPWVRFGVSPFGIWRNKKSDKRGSDTNGLENYDALYADVLLWAEKGWVDYLIPQLYWELEHPRASYSVLIDWWNNNAGQRHVYIGQHTEVTMKKNDLKPSAEASQLKTKIAMSRKAEAVQGNCWWPAYSVTKNFGGIADSLASIHHAEMALPPEYPWISSSTPEAPFDLHKDHNELWWSAPAPEGKTDDCIKFVIYRFDDDSTFDLDDPSKIVGITYENHIPVSTQGYYVVTSLDRANSESFPSEPLMIK